MQDEPGPPARPEPGRATYLITNVPRVVADYWHAQPAGGRQALDQSLVSFMIELAAPISPQVATADGPGAWTQLKLEASAWRAAIRGRPEADRLVPASTVIAKLEAKLASAQRLRDRLKGHATPPDETLVLQSSTDDRKYWIPARVMISDYPQLKELAWQVHTTHLRPVEAWGIYDRNWRHVNEGALTQSERDLIEALRIAFEV